LAAPQTLRAICGDPTPPPPAYLDEADDLADDGELFAVLHVIVGVEVLPRLIERSLGPRDAKSRLRNRIKG
jgi:hypothetical protein